MTTKDIEIEDETMDKIMALAATNTTIRKHLTRVNNGEADYGTALEELVLELATQIQTLQNRYRGVH